MLFEYIFFVLFEYNILIYLYARHTVIDRRRSASLESTQYILASDV